MKNVTFAPLDLFQKLGLTGEQIESVVSASAPAASFLREHSLGVACLVGGNILMLAVFGPAWGVVVPLRILGFGALGPVSGKYFLVVLINTSSILAHLEDTNFTYPCRDNCGSVAGDIWRICTRWIHLGIYAKSGYGAVNGRPVDSEDGSLAIANRLKYGKGRPDVF